jgi:hypothetical protein
MSTVPLANPLAVLRLDARDVRVTAHAADGYGSLLARTSEPGHQARAATMKIRAAACWCLVSPPRAPAAFAAATRLYERMGHPFAIAAAICAGQQTPPERGSGRPMAPDDRAYDALRLAWSLTSGMTPADAALEMLAGPADDREWFPAGQLEVPVRCYLEFARGVALALRSGDSQVLRDSLPQLLQRATEPVRMAMADLHRWQALATGVMPVEPELLAIGRIAHRTLVPWDEHTLSNLGIPRNSVERVPLWIARVLDEPPDSRRPPGDHPPSSGPNSAEAAATARAEARRTGAARRVRTKPSARPEHQ